MNNFLHNLERRYFDFIDKILFGFFRNKSVNKDLGEIPKGNIEVNTFVTTQEQQVVIAETENEEKDLFTRKNIYFKKEKQLNKFINTVEFRFNNDTIANQDAFMNEFKELLRDYSSELTELHSTELLSVEELSKVFNLSKSLIYKLTSSNKIPYHKNSKEELYFIKNEIIEWIKKS